MNLNFKDVFYFEAMLTPKLIVVIYWLLLFAAIISGLGVMIGGRSFGAFIGGLLTIIIGIVFARIWCELLIVSP